VREVTTKDHGGSGNGGGGGDKLLLLLTLIGASCCHGAVTVFLDCAQFKSWQPWLLLFSVSSGCKMM